jgi:hypothetical protein
MTTNGNATFPTDGEPDWSVTIDGETHEFHNDDLELWEIETIEEAAGCPINQIDGYRASVLRAVAFIAMHRVNPRFTMDDAKHLKLGRFGTREEPVAEERPAPRKRPTKAATAATDA